MRYMCAACLCRMLLDAETAEARASSAVAKSAPIIPLRMHTSTHISIKDDDDTKRNKTDDVDENSGSRIIAIKMTIANGSPASRLWPVEGDGLGRWTFTLRLQTSSQRIR